MTHRNSWAGQHVADSRLTYCRRSGSDTFAKPLQNRVLLPRQHLFLDAARKKAPKTEFLYWMESQERREGAAYDSSSSQRNVAPGQASLRRAADRGRARLRRWRIVAVPARWSALVGAVPSWRGGCGPASTRGSSPGCYAQAPARRGRLDGAGGVEAGCLRSRAAGQPGPSAGARVGCLHPPRRHVRAADHRAPVDGRNENDLLSTSGPASPAHCPIAANDLDPAITAAIPTASSPASA